MVAEIVGAAAAVVAALAELLHWRRSRRVAMLAFGPRGRPLGWVYPALGLRVLALGGLAWGLVTLMTIEPVVHEAEAFAEEDYRHVLLVLDVSPSMRLQDAGPSGTQSRMARARDVMESFFKRVPIEQYRISVVAVYNGAKPVVVETTDIDVVRNILSDLPMHYAFRVGKTQLFSGLAEAVKIARPWPPKNTTVLLVTDGDTVPAKGMPEMPPSVSGVVVVGVGDEVSGQFIDGRQSRQDASTLRQMAVRLRGTYHNGNKKQLSSALLQELTATVAKGRFEELTRREYALIVCGLGAALLALLPLLLHLFGTRWNPGVVPEPAARRLPSAAAAQGLL